MGVYIKTTDKTIFFRKKLVMEVKCKTSLCSSSFFHVFYFWFSNLHPKRVFFSFFIFPNKVVEKNKEETVREQYKGKKSFLQQSFDISVETWIKRGNGNRNELSSPSTDAKSGRKQ